MSSSCIAPDRPVTVRKAQGEDVAGLYNLLVTTSYRHMICLTVFPDDLTKAGKGGEGVRRPELHRLCHLYRLQSTRLEKLSASLAGSGEWRVGAESGLNRWPLWCPRGKTVGLAPVEYASVIEVLSSRAFS